MFERTGAIIDIGDKLCELAKDQAKWSEATFGTDQMRGPMGALKHLELESREAQADPTNKEEYADCLLLILDASRRAGMTVMDLLREATRKQRINEKRSWPKPTSDEPVEHIESVG